MLSLLLLKAGRRSLMAAAKRFLPSPDRILTRSPWPLQQQLQTFVFQFNSRSFLQFSCFLDSSCQASAVSVLSWSVAPSRQLSKQLLTRINNSPLNHTQPCLLRPHPWKLASRRSWPSAPNSLSSRDSVLCAKRSSHQPARVEMQQRYVEDGHIKVRSPLTPLAHLSFALAC